MATYSLSFAGLQEAVAEIGTISSQINSFLEELNSGTLRSITEWESGARTEFDSQRQIWSNAANDMTVQAANARAALDSIIATYSDGENYGIKLWAR